MRISYLTSWNERCGIAAYSSRLVAALRRSEAVEVVPASFGSAPAAVYRAMGEALNLGDVAHVQHSYAFFGGMHPLRCGWGHLAGTVRRPLLVTVHEMDDRATGRLPDLVEAAYKRRFNRRVFLHPAVRRWLVHALPLRDALIELGAPADRVTHVPLPAETAPPPPDPEPLRRELRLQGKRPLVVLGFLSRRKGYEVALAALRSLPEEFVLVAAGGEHAADRTGTEAWLHAEASRLGVRERLRVTGYLSEPRLEQAAALAEVVLAPFFSMSASASLNFALARGKAVVASDLPETRAVPAVHLVPAGCPAALAAAVSEIAAHPDLKRRLELDALRYAAAHGYDALAATTRRIYAEMLAAR